MSQLRRTIEATARVAAWTIAGHSVAILATPLLSRLYGPQDFALFATLSSITSMGCIFVTLRFEQAIPSQDSVHEASALTVLALAGATLFSLPVALVAATVAASVGMLPTGHLVAFTSTLGAALVLTAAMQALRLLAARERRFVAISRASFLQLSLRGVGGVVLSALVGGGLGLFSGELVARCSSSVVLLRDLLGELRQTIRISSATVVAQVRRNLFWSTYGIPSALLDTASLVIPTPLFVAAYGASAAGQFAMIDRLLVLPASVIGSAAADAFTAEAVGIVAASRGHLAGFVRRFALRLSLASLAIFVPVALFAPRLIAPLLGSRWNAGAGLIPVVSLSAAIAFVVSPISRLILVLRRPGAKLPADLALASAPIIATFWGTHTGASFEDTVSLYCVLSAISYGIYAGIIWRITLDWQRDADRRYT